MGGAFLLCQNVAMHPELERLLARDSVVADGAYGTALQAQSTPVELLNLTRPEAVAALARDYVAAGARVLWTNTFGVAMPALRDDQRALEIVRQGVAIAREAGGEVVPVLAAFGPVGEGTEVAWYVRAAEVAAEVGACGVVLETQTNARQAAAAAEGLAARGQSVLVSFTLQRGAAGELLTHCGTALREAVRLAEDAGAISVGVNCCDGPSTVLEAVDALKGNVGTRVFARPNAGVTDTMSPAQFADYGRALREAGAWLIGGCCGTGPDHIRALPR